MTTGPAIRLDNVSVERSGNRVLRDVSFSVSGGSLVGVLGPNGAGKSTLFDTMAGLLPVAEGDLVVDGELAYVPQRVFINWRFPISVLEVVLLGRCGGGRLVHRPNRSDRALARAALERVGMWERRSSLVAELSGGQRQRVFIARALAQEATILLLDEAFSGVDVGATLGIMQVLQSLRDEGCIVLLATHDLTDLAERFDNVLCMHGHMCAWGPPAEVATPEALQELYGHHGAGFQHVDVTEYPWFVAHDSHEAQEAHEGHDGHAGHDGHEPHGGHESRKAPSDG